MNILKTTILLATTALCTTSWAQQGRTEPMRVRIGETILTLQAPLQLQSAKESATNNVKKYPRHSEGIYIGFGFAAPTRESDYLPIHSGNSFNLEVGCRYLHHPSRYYTIGTFLQYSYYSYRMKEASMTFMGYMPNGNISREFFRTDNIGTGIIQRIRLLPRTQLEGIVYGDWAYSKRFVVKSRVDGNKEKSKYRDGTKFNPFGAGAQAGLRRNSTTVYARYRFTNFFNPDYISTEVPRLSIGISFGL